MGQRGSPTTDVILMTVLWRMIDVLVSRIRGFLTLRTICSHPALSISALGLGIAQEPWTRPFNIPMSACKWVSRLHSFRWLRA